LSVYNPVKKSFTNYSVASGHLKSDVIFDLFKQKNGNMLISTIGVGVTVYDQNKSGLLPIRRRSAGVRPGGLSVPWRIKRGLSGRGPTDWG
jgi:hypothetical protein